MTEFASSHSSAQAALQERPYRELPVSDLRIELDSLVEDAGKNAFSGTAAGSKLAAEQYTLAAERAGMTILELRDPGTDVGLDYYCGSYTLGTKLNAEWFPPENILSLFDDPVAFLEQQGYSAVQAPRNGDLAVYLTLESDRAPMEMHHIGLVTEGKVESKLNYGPIVQHDFENIPNSYGEILMFFRQDILDLNTTI